MIGDWVEVILNSEKHFAQVQMIDGYGDNATSNECVCDAIYYSIDELKPIQLTVEILGRNEFKENRFGMYELERQNLYLERCGDAYWFGRSFDGSDFYGYAVVRAIKVKYVHELQHILRMCGMNELVDNFKI